MKQATPSTFNKMATSSGMIVQHEDGRKGRTKREDKPVDVDGKNKLKVYFEKTTGKLDFSDQATLVNPDKLKGIGYID